MSGSISGLGSSQITSELNTIEQRLQAPITELQDQAATDKAEISSWGTIQGAISTLSSSLSGIEDVSTINTRTATGGGGFFTATAGSAAQTGTFNVNVKSLASVQEIFSSTAATSSASAAATIGAGSGSLTFTLKGGKTETVQVGSGSMTLNGIAAAINKVAGGVKAGVVSTANGAELTLQSSATGSSQAFSVNGTGTLAKFDFSSGSSPSANAPMQLAQKAGNAALTINGVPITSTSNDISSALTGVSLNLTATGTSTLTIGSSTNSVSSAVNKVATDLNAAISTIAKQTLFVSASSASASASASSGKKSGALAGNINAENISNQLLSAVSGAAASGMTSNLIGLTVSSKGAVALNATTFASAFAKNPTAVTKLLGQIETSLSTVTKQALGSSTSTSAGTSVSAGEGIITAQTNALQNTVTSVNSEISQMEKTDTTQLDTIAAAFTAAESAATNASITSLFLDSFLGTSSTSSTSGG
ncbi:MAG TPA: flagellar filament capping protein FliD [Acidocella sp.]|jgi:flagellar hook-associated protein 2|uniref:flagellar filament capping protein FliD n=1 Tax=Acidocella sp. TaxID=50710 RepID=UPI002BBA7EFA|nr:flagellar filament capping protein FliD [Acidocella sp.]HVE22008.1 flagellar filament capping protein FliD [Acidocella sp.]